MKATLEFNLPDDQEDFDIATQGRNRLIALLKTKEKLRQACIKHQLDAFLDKHAYNAYLEKDVLEEQVVSVDSLTEYLYNLYTDLVDLQSEDTTVY